MEYPIRFTILGPEKGNPRQVKACLSKESSKYLVTQLGTFRYFHFLRDLFEDISKFHRIGNMVFYKPGLGDICISWGVIETMTRKEIQESVIDGMENLNRTHIDRYRDKFSLVNSIPFQLENKELQARDSFLLVLNIKVASSQKIAVNVD